MAFGAGLSAQPLESALRERIRDFPGTVTLYARNLDTGATIGIRETDPVRTASTIKLPVMLTVFDAVARGQAKWTDMLTVTAQDKVSGSGVIGSEFSEGVQLPLSDVVHLMIVLSDNSATNMLVERFTADAVNAYLDKLGIKTTRLMRKVMGRGGDPKPIGRRQAARKSEVRAGHVHPEGHGRNPRTAGERRPGRIQGDDRDSQAATGQYRHAPLSLRVIPIANKTGALDALRADVGIVYSKAGRIAMAIYVDGIPKPDYGPDNQGSLIISDLSKLIVERLATPARE